ncbi:MAG: 50S ribosomal protein L10 [Elusimicrobiales bacterium]|jgi:large subunit ribosomal protein L10|nr:50S ribosomal protein L10 [Elusimicrobiales bacterium]
MANLTKAKKVELSKKLKDEIVSGDIIFVAFDGLTFEKLQALRDKLKSHKSNIKVIRNSVLFYASKDGGILSDSKKPDFLKGPTAAIFVKDSDEISSVSKALLDFAKENPTLRIKGGFLSKDIITPEIIKQISKVGSKKELLAKLAGALYSSMSNMRSVVEAPVRDLAYVLTALKEKKEKGS